MQTGTATAAPTHVAALAAQKKELEEEMFEKQPIDALATQKIELETRFSITALHAQSQRHQIQLNTTTVHPEAIPSSEHDSLERAGLSDLYRHYTDINTAVMLAQAIKSRAFKSKQSPLVPLEPRLKKAARTVVTASP
jgi:hypothetical protein